MSALYLVGVYTFIAPYICVVDSQILLESNVMDFNAMLVNLEKLHSKLVSAESMTILQLSVTRNALLSLNTKISILAAAIALGGE